MLTLKSLTVNAKSKTKISEGFLNYKALCF